MLALTYFFRILYWVLLVRGITNYIRYTQKQPKQPFKFLLKVFEETTAVFCKPFQNIFYFNYDLSPFIAIAFTHYLAEPITRFIFNLCLIIIGAFL